MRHEELDKKNDFYVIICTLPAERYLEGNKIDFVKMVWYVYGKTHIGVLGNLSNGRC